jgi:hypothetical protein
MADWGYALGQGIGAGAKSASGIMDAQIKEDADIRAANRQLELQERLNASQELMQQRAREHAYQIQQRPAQAAGGYLRGAAAERPMTASDVTELSGADPDSEFNTGDGSPVQGMRGNYAELVERGNRIPDPTIRAEYMAQIERQRAADARGKAKPRSREEQIAAGMEAALASGDVQSYNALKALVPEKFVPLNENGLYNTATGEVIQPTTNKADRERERDDRRFEQQMELQRMRDESSERRADARADFTASRETSRAEAKELAKKLAPVPVAAQKQRETNLEAIATASGIQDELSKVQKQIETGKLDFGVIENAKNSVLNAVGASTEASRNFASFKATMERLRNESLRLNAGVQTDGDAQRAWNELIANINDKDVVMQRLAEISALNRRAAEIRKQNVNLIQQNYEKDPIDFSPYENAGKPKPDQGAQNKLAPGVQSLVDKYRSR